ncbi:MAG: ATP-binding cassette domain-containing protein [Acidimicrobiales bacterium]|nr:ATP-binding cassette domain-containing protein [Acidimicrobiales bacterium]
MTSTAVGTNDATAHTGLSVRGLDVDRGGRRVVRGVDLDVAPGEIVALLGPNGAGRSSTIETLAGLLPASGGTYTCDGAALLGLRPEAIRRAGVATVLSNHRVLGGLSVRDNLLAAAGATGRERDDRVLDAIRTFPELDAHLARTAKTLSGGQQQMLALGQALVCRPRYLVIDEMSHGLAPAIVARLLEVLRQVSATGVGILLVEQFANVALRLADRAVVMSRGHVVHHGPSSRYLDDPDLLHRLYLGLDAEPGGAGEPDEPAGDQKS